MTSWRARRGRGSPWSRRSSKHGTSLWCAKEESGYDGRIPYHVSNPSPFKRNLLELERRFILQLERRSEGLRSGLAPLWHLRLRHRWQECEAAACTWEWECGAHTCHCARHGGAASRRTIRSSRAVQARSRTFHEVVARPATTHHRVSGAEAIARLDCERCAPHHLVLSAASGELSQGCEPLIKLVRGALPWPFEPISFAVLRLSQGPTKRGRPRGLLDSSVWRRLVNWFVCACGHRGSVPSVIKALLRRIRMPATRAVTALLVVISHIARVPSSTSTCSAQGCSSAQHANAQGARARVGLCCRVHGSRELL